MAASLLLILAVGAAPATPTELYRSVCMDGGASLDGGSVVTRKFAELPTGARAAYGRIQLRSLFGGKAVAATAVPKKVYQVSGIGETYLIVPDRSGDSVRANNATCAVLTKGDHLLEARDVMLGKLSSAAFAPPPGQVALPYFDVELGGYRLVGAEAEGWTVMSSTPLSVTSGAQHQ
ncbi:hypothetical protein QH494_23150 [Sphingomonas sp. AR_OL41]|uniref:hypothetical protein n=1 Tax=Sphingomonas sp. AR_OL41 TaxID=3042729 RepID=UPI002480505F|nr:hypothetical protein [Sphingomonas sp. AR_OL41]MDH7975092.1 hypothetical protein [Sphingomonas sp. AR_OL41]